MRVKSTLKRCLTAALALCLLTLSLSTAFAQGGDSYPKPDSGSCGPDAVYTFKDGVLTISGTGAVTTSEYGWPSGVTSVIIEDGITSLPYRAFYYLSVTQVVVPDSVTYIGDIAFTGTPWLDAQTDEFVIVGDGILLDYNGSADEVTIPDTVRSIAGSAFRRSDITAITVGDTVEHIGESAFSECPRLERVSIADTISDIEGSILSVTPWMKAQTGDFVIVGDGVLIAYKGPDGVVEVPDTVHAIARWSLYYYYEDENGRTISITEITIPETVTRIDSFAFAGGRAVNGVIVEPPVIIRGAPGSAAQKFAESGSDSELYRFIPFGQEDGSLSNFMNLRYYHTGKFADVTKSDWFYDNVETVYTIGLMNGKTDETTGASFDPEGQIKLSEAVVVAARMRDTYYYEQIDFSTAGTWYQPYVDYALAHGIIAEAFDDWERPATRAELASMLAAALPERELEAINETASFTDVSESHPAYSAMTALARAGIMQGKGEGRFDPTAPVKRCEVAAMLARCVRPAQRVQLG